MNDFEGVQRLRDEWPEGREYRATVRNFGGNVEMSVRAVQADEKARRCHTQVPVHLAERRRLSEAEREARKVENQCRAVRRARQGVRWSLKAMGADHMATLTTRENVQDEKRMGEYFQRFTRLVRARYPDLRYVAVKELQERGAIHIHLALSGRFDVHWLRRCWWMALGHRVEIDYSEPKKRLRALVKDGREWRYAGSEEVRGNVDIRGPSRRWGGDGRSWKVEKLAAYMTKYMAKAFEEVGHGRRYWPSKNIVRPEPVKFWLSATDFEGAVREAHGLMRNRYMVGELTIWHSPDWLRLWFSGGDLGCPF